MPADVLLFSAIGLFAFAVRGVVGAASAIVFNAVFITLHALGLTGGLSLRDGLYWFALANTVAALGMLVTLARSVRLERLTVLFLLGMLPVNVVFTLLLTRLDDNGPLAIALAVVVSLAGLHLALRPRLPPAPARTLHRVAAPSGMAAGVLAGLYGMGGPVGVLFFSRAADDPSLFRMRSTIVGSSAGVIRLLTLAAEGVYTPDRLRTAAWTLPAVAIGVATGFWAHRFVRPGPFRVLLGALITVAGVVAMAQTLL